MKYKIYGLTESVGEIRHIYIGFTSRTLEERLRKHIQRAERNYKYSWIKSLKNKNELPRIFLIKNSNLKNWQKDEAMEIAMWRNNEVLTGIKVLNMTDGGEGTLGHKHTTKTKKLFSKQRFGIKHKPHSIETKYKMSLAAKGNKNAAGTKKTKKWRDTMAKFTGRNHWSYGKVQSLETIKRRSLSVKKLSDKDIMLVKKHSQEGSLIKNIAVKFNVSQSTIRRIIKNEPMYLKDIA